MVRDGKAEIPSVWVRLKASSPEEAAKAVKRILGLRSGLYMSPDHTLMVGDLGQLKKFAKEKGWRVEDTGKRLRKKDYWPPEFDGGRFRISRDDARRALNVFRGPKILRTGPDMSWAVFTSRGKALALPLWDS